VGTEKRNRQKQNRQAAREARARQARRAKVRGRASLYGGILAAVLVLVFAISQLGGGEDSPADVTDTTSVEEAPSLSTVPGRQVTGDTPCPKTDGTEERATVFEKAPPTCIDAAKKYTATFDTSEGKIVVALDTEKTPNTVNNFVVLSRYKYYDGSYIFRTDPSLDIIQGGGQDNTDGPGYVIPDEGNEFSYTEGDLVMARSAGPDSGGGQFFFVTGPKASVLDAQGTYVTFGKVSKGLDVTKAILALNEGAGDLGGAPSRPVQIRTITITEE